MATVLHKIFSLYNTSWFARHVQSPLLIEHSTAKHPGGSKKPSASQPNTWPAARRHDDPAISDFDIMASQHCNSRWRQSKTFRTQDPVCSSSVIPASGDIAASQKLAALLWPSGPGSIRASSILNSRVEYVTDCQIGFERHTNAPRERPAAES